MPTSSAPSDRPGRMSTRQQATARPRGGLLDSLEEDGISWEGAVLIVGHDGDIPAWLTVTAERLVLTRDANILLEVPRSWLVPAPLRVQDQRVRVSITPEGVVPGQASTERLLLDIQQGRGPAQQLAAILAGRTRREQLQAEFPTWHGGVGAGLSLPPLPAFEATQDTRASRTHDTSDPETRGGVPIDAWGSAQQNAPVSRPDIPFSAPVEEPVEPQSRAARFLSAREAGPAMAPIVAPARRDGTRGPAAAPVTPIDEERKKRGAGWGIWAGRIAMVLIIALVGSWFARDYLPDEVTERLPALLDGSGDLALEPSDATSPSSNAISGDGTLGAGADPNDVMPTEAAIGVGGTTSEIPESIETEEPTGPGGVLPTPTPPSESLEASDDPVIGQQPSDEGADTPDAGDSAAIIVPRTDADEPGDTDIPSDPPVDAGEAGQADGNSDEQPVPADVPEPTIAPTETPEPTVAPTETPEPTVAPTETPEPTVAPTETPEPTVAPTETPEPTIAPTETPEPTIAPTETPEPTIAPTETPEPTVAPTQTPEPTIAPTETPEPTIAPTQTPEPTIAPTETPEPTIAPTQTPEPTIAPTEEATDPEEPTLESQPPSVSEDDPPVQQFADDGIRYSIEGATSGTSLPDLPEINEVTYGEWLVLAMVGQNWTATEQIFDMRRFTLIADGQSIQLDVGNSWVASMLDYRPAYGNTSATLWAAGEEHPFVLTFLAPRDAESLILQAGDQQLDLRSVLENTPRLGEMRQGELPEAFEATVVEVIDGETILIEKDGVEQTVRYLGVDVPGENACYFGESTEMNRELTEGRVVRIERQATDTDARGNWVRDVWVEQDDGGFALVAHQLVESGAATVNISEPNTRFASWLSSAESVANAEDRGLWSACEQGTAPSPPAGSTGTISVVDRRGV